jgi:hypothetical protein
MMLHFSKNVNKNVIVSNACAAQETCDFYRLMWLVLNPPFGPDFLFSGTYRQCDGSRERE